MRLSIVLYLIFDILLTNLSVLCTTGNKRMTMNALVD